MTNKPKSTRRSTAVNTKRASTNKFHVEFLNAAQKMAWAAYQQHEVLFLVGPAGTGKTHLAVAFAIHDILNKERKRIVLTRPIVEAGESLGYLPGEFENKVNPYMMPMYDCVDALVPENSPQRESLERSLEVAPIAYMRGRTFNNSVCVFDEAQNATKKQLKLFLSRFGENSKIIITGDPQQSDLGDDVALTDVMNRVENIPGVSIIKFKKDSIVRHPLVSAILEKLEE